MKKLTLFILIYSACFFILSIITTNIFEKSHSSNEMLSFVVYGCIAYIIVGSLTWIPINWLAMQSQSKALGATIRFCLGLIVLNFLAAVAGSGVILTLNLLCFDIKDTTFWMSLAVHGIYAISFFIASLVFATNEKQQESVLGD